MEGWLLGTRDTVLVGDPAREATSAIGESVRVICITSA